MVEVGPQRGDGRDQYIRPASQTWQTGTQTSHNSDTSLTCTYTCCAGLSGLVSCIAFQYWIQHSQLGCLQLGRYQVGGALARSMVVMGSNPGSSCASFASTFCFGRITLLFSLMYMYTVPEVKLLALD